MNKRFIRLAVSCQRYIRSLRRASHALLKLSEDRLQESSMDCRNLLNMIALWLECRIIARTHAGLLHLGDMRRQTQTHAIVHKLGVKLKKQGIYWATKKQLVFQQPGPGSTKIGSRGAEEYVTA